MYPFKFFQVRSYEIGLHFRGGEFLGLLDEGPHWFFDPSRSSPVDRRSSSTRSST
jgi:hypothetical protein